MENMRSPAAVQEPQREAGSRRSEAAVAAPERAGVTVAGWRPRWSRARAAQRGRPSARAGSRVRAGGGGRLQTVRRPGAEGAGLVALRRGIAGAEGGQRTAGRGRDGRAARPPAPAGRPGPRPSGCAAAGSASRARPCPRLAATAARPGRAAQRDRDRRVAGKDVVHARPLWPKRFDSVARYGRGPHCAARPGLRGPAPLLQPETIPCPILNGARSASARPPASDSTTSTAAPS
jgi:hypothetical protein